MSNSEFNPFAPASKKQAMMLNAIETTQITIIGGAAGCLPAEAQFLTDKGWVDFDKYEEGMVVAQYNPYQDVISFTDKVEYVKLEENELTRFHGADGFYMTLSDEHRVLYADSNNLMQNTISVSEIKSNPTWEGWIPQGLHDGGYVKVTNLNTETIPTSDGYKYCFVTETGFLPVRENGKIYLTGNSGKSYILQLVPLLFADDPKAQCIMFRRTTPQLKGQGGIWDTAKGIYLSLPKGKRPRIREKDSEIIFPNYQDPTAGDGMVVKYSHMQHEDDKLNHQGLQYTFVGFDEGCQFSWTQIDYLMSRLRSESKYFSRMAISCNPDSEHKIKEMIQWYLDEDGYPIPERDGVVRYFIRVDGDFVWGETAKELTDVYGEDFEPLSLTFVSATIK